MTALVEAETTVIRQYPVGVDQSVGALLFFYGFSTTEVHGRFSTTEVHEAKRPGKYPDEARKGVQSS
jgi:hypothetical protein